MWTGVSNSCKVWSDSKYSTWQSVCIKATAPKIYLSQPEGPLDPLNLLNKSCLECEKLSSSCKPSTLLRNRASWANSNSRLPHRAEPQRSAIYRRTSWSRETGDGRCVEGERGAADMWLKQRKEKERESENSVSSCTFPSTSGLFPRKICN